MQPRAFVLAGGHSTRMGRDKAQLPYQDRTLLAHALTTLARAGFTPAVAGLVPDPDNDILHIPDAIPHLGPLSGILAGLRSLADQPTQPALFLAVDLPLMKPAFLRLLHQRAEATAAEATVPMLGGRPQPLCALYSTHLAQPIANALANNHRKVTDVLTSILPEAHFDKPRVEALAAANGWTNPHRWFTNLNTPEDYKHFAPAIYSGTEAP